MYTNGRLMSTSLLHITVNILNCKLLLFQSGLAYDMQSECLSTKPRQTAIDNRNESNLKNEIVYPEATEATEITLLILRLFHLLNCSLVLICVRNCLRTWILFPFLTLIKNLIFLLLLLQGYALFHIPKMSCIYEDVNRRTIEIP